MSFNTPRGDTSPRDMAERCLWIGYDCMVLLGSGCWDGMKSTAEMQ